MDQLDRHSPTYAAAFRCIGTACEDPCCSGFDIPVDKATYAAYQQLPKENVASLISQFVVLNPAGSHDNLYARIVPTPSGECPFWTAERLCGIQSNYGPQLLPATCSIYPRALRVVDGQLEGSLSLSCPEAARNVLLSPGFMDGQHNLYSGDFRTDSFFHLGSSPGTASLHAYAHPVRSLLVELIRDRRRPLWQRLLWIGTFCLDLERCSTPETSTMIPHLLDTYRSNRSNEQLWNSLDEFAPDPRLKLEVVFALTNERLRNKGSGKRLQDTFWAFIEGIATPDPTVDGDDLARFLHAEQTHYQPYLTRSPFILENYLINYFFQHLFPFGREGSTARSIFDEYLLMATQFAWINALLIGITAHRKEAFGAGEIISTIQSFTRAVEHYPEVLNYIPEYMRSRNLNDLRGMGIMLRS